MYSTADQISFVNQFDKDFTSAPKVNSSLLNKDGTPKVLFHQTEGDFTEFTVGRKGEGQETTKRLSKYSSKAVIGI